MGNNCMTFHINLKAALQWSGCLVSMSHLTIGSLKALVVLDTLNKYKTVLEVSSLVFPIKDRSVNISGWGQTHGQYILLETHDLENTDRRIFHRDLRSKVVETLANPFYSILGTGVPKIYIELAGHKI
jgi:hypothetical protein